MRTGGSQEAARAGVPRAGEGLLRNWEQHPLPMGWR